MTALGIATGWVGALVLVLLGGCGANGSGTFDAGRLGDAPSGIDAPGAAACALCAPHALLVDGAWLETHLNEPGLLAVDVRDRSGYEADHVVGAVNLPVSEVTSTVDGVPGQVAAPEAVARALGSAGITPEATVIAYGDQGGLWAARLLWTLAYHGHADVRLLDGGLPGWRAQGRPTERGATTAVPAVYPVPAVVPTLRVDVPWLLDRLEEPSVHIIDVRTPAEYEAGHIPGARNLEWTRATNGSGFMLPVGDLELLFADVPRGGTVVTYCTTGVRGSMGYVTARWLGYVDVRLYDGSWAEWGTRTDVPVRTGSTP